MPYVITTTRRLIERNPDATHERSSRAVATLEEARGMVAAMIGSRLPDAAAHERASQIPWNAAGGTVGPLPDGTVIEVERVQWDALVSHQLVGEPSESPERQTEIIDAFNARQAS